MVIASINKKIMTTNKKKIIFGKFWPLLRTHFRIFEFKNKIRNEKKRENCGIFKVCSLDGV